MSFEKLETVDKRVYFLEHFREVTKMMRRGVKMTNDRLRRKCIDNNWFTCGSCRQYDKLFDMNNDGASLFELAIAIWICSDDGWTVKAIQKKLEEL